MKSVDKLRPVRKLFLYCLPMLLLGQVHAASIVTSGTASGLGLYVDLSQLSFDVGAGPYAETNVSAPVPDDEAALLLNLSVSLGALGSLESLGDISAVSLEASAISDVDGLSSSAETVGSASVQSFELSLGSKDIFTSGDLSIRSSGAQYIRSSSSVTGSYGALLGVGQSELGDVTLSISGVDFNLSNRYAANTLLDVSAAGVAGITVHLNEQIISGTGLDGYSLVTNAMRIQLQSFHLGGGLGLVSGDIIVGQSSAQMTAIPEPGTLWSLVIGTVGLMLLHRRVIGWAHRTKYL
ncbi:PEP-CTERM sorting domain-containing protein [Kiritimatiellaeota bacterium B1221]|nr:PEP-CTERM sorting domain-containing protein [Kiritimatiellaeota bacterium B1221]